MARKRSYPIDLTGDDSLISGHPYQNKQPCLANQNASNAPTSSGNGSFPATQAGQEFEVVDLSQNGVDEGVGWTSIGAIDAKIVGIQYYSGYATRGERVMAQREPHNQYDRNAIRINNVQGNQIGHIPRQLAAKLAPHMDAKSVVVEGILAGEVGSVIVLILSLADVHPG